MVLLDKVANPVTRDWSATRGVVEGWSRAVLVLMVASDLHPAPGCGPVELPGPICLLAIGDHGPGMIGGRAAPRLTTRLPPLDLTTLGPLDLSS